MLDNSHIYTFFNDKGISFFTGVPDSTLKDFCAYITEFTPKHNHIITANEGGAIALASGYYVATGRVPLVYMQNSGIGNAINPLASLADPDVYSIPLLIMIGWRGEPGIKDEPQHKKQGKITTGLLETLGISYAVLPDSEAGAKTVIGNAVDTVKNKKKSYALLVRKNTFLPYKLTKKKEESPEIERERAICIIAQKIGRNDVIVSTTGKISRELYEFRDRENSDHTHDFLSIGSMGHCSHIALGIAIAKPQKTVFCFDGDGSVLMHMGSLAINGTQNITNFKHILFNNGAHDSVGGQPTVGRTIDFTSIAKSCGYRSVFRVKKPDELDIILPRFIKETGPAFLEIYVKKGARKDLGRPKLTPIELKDFFTSYIRGKE